MADLYARSSDGSDADDGSTWALAKAKISGATAIDAAGDTIWVSKLHSESTSSTLTMSVAGTAGSPVRILCCDDTGDPEPPTALSTGAVVATTMSNPILLTGGHCYVYGIEFSAGSSSNSVYLALQGNPSASQGQTYEKCKFKLGATSSSATIRVVSSAPYATSRTQWIDCDVQLAHASQRIITYGAAFEWCGGALLMGTSPTYLLSAGGSGYAAQVRMDGVDLSAADAAIDICNGQSSGAMDLLVRRCTLPTDWTGNLFSGTVLAGVRGVMLDCDEAGTGTNYRVWVEDFAGSIRDDTGIYLSDGDYDGTTRFSHRYITKATCNELSGRFCSHEFSVWNDVTTGTVDVSFEIVHDSATDLTTADVWPEVFVRDDASSTQGTWVRGGVADILTAGTNWPNSSETWTGTGGFTNPNKQTLSVTISPRVKGPLQCRIVCAIASKTFYAHPVGVVA